MRPAISMICGVAARACFAMCLHVSSSRHTCSCLLCSYLWITTLDRSLLWSSYLQFACSVELCGSSSSSSYRIKFEMLIPRSISFFAALARNICYSPAGRSVLGKTVPEVLDTALGLRPRAVLKTEGTVFPNTDRPRLVNNILIFFLNRTKGVRKTRTF